MAAGREASAALNSEQRFLQPRCHLRPAQRPPRQAAAQRTAVQLIQGVRAVIGAHLALNRRQVHAERGEQIGRVPARPVAGSGRDDAGYGSPRRRQADAPSGQDVPRGRVLVGDQREQQVLAADVTVASPVGFLTRRTHQPGGNRVPAWFSMTCHVSLRPGNRRLAYLRCTDWRVTPSAPAILSPVPPPSPAVLTPRASSCATLCPGPATGAPTTPRAPSMG